MNKRKDITQWISVKIELRQTLAKRGPGTKQLSIINLIKNA